MTTPMREKVLLLVAKFRKYDKLIDAIDTPRGCLSMGRLERGIFRGDWTREDEAHLAMCGSCSFNRDVMTKMIWHARPIQIWRLATGNPSKHDDSVIQDAAEAWHHLFDHRCLSCRKAYRDFLSGNLAVDGWGRVVRIGGEP